MKTLRILQLVLSIPTFALMAYAPLWAVPLAFALGAVCTHVDIRESGETRE